MAFKKLVFMLVSIMILFSSACSGGASLPITMTSTPSSSSIPEVIPEPAEGKGSVVGQLEASDPTALFGLLLYLGDVIVVEDQYGGFLDREKAPSTWINNEKGKFYFQDVEPGEYTLIVYEVEAGGKVYLDSTGSAVLINVEPGKILDLGKIQLQD